MQNILICGAGKVGLGIAERLAREGNVVSVIDRNVTLVQAIQERLDVRGFVGDAAHPEVLLEGGIDQADMIIAVTQLDEINMVACQIAHSLFNVPIKIARIRSQSYLETRWRNLFSSDHMPIDVIISPEVEVGKRAISRIDFPGTFDAVHLAENQALAIGVELGEDCPIIDTSLRQVSELFPDLQSSVVGILRDNNVFIPSTRDSLRVGDCIYFIAYHKQVQRALSILGSKKQPANKIVIAGAGNIGCYVASILAARGDGKKVRLIEKSPANAMQAAEQLPQAVVLQGDALDLALQQEADVDSADIILALTSNDEVNVISCILAKKLGCHMAMCLTNNPDYPFYLNKVGIDAFIDPKAVTISKVLRHLRRGRILGIYSVWDGAAEIIEGEALKTSPLVGKKLSDKGLFSGFRVGAIYRNNEVIIPNSETIINPHDRLLLFCLSNNITKVERLFRVSLDFF